MLLFPQQPYPRPLVCRRLFLNATMAVVSLPRARKVIRAFGMVLLKGRSQCIERNCTPGVGRWGLFSITIQEFLRASLTIASVPLKMTKGNIFVLKVTHERRNNAGECLTLCQNQWSIQPSTVTSDWQQLCMVSGRMLSWLPIHVLTRINPALHLKPDETKKKKQVLWYPLAYGTWYSVTSAATLSNNSTFW